MYVERFGDVIAQGLFLAHRPAAIQWRGRLCPNRRL